MHPEWFFIPFLPTLGFLLALFLLVHLFRTHRSPSSAFAWLLAIVLVPYVGVPLYILFGGRKMRRMAEGKEHYIRLDRAAPGSEADSQRTLPGGIEAIFQLESGNRFQTLSTGEEAYRSLTRAIRGAKKSIFITTYILGNDETGTALIDILAQKTREGIEVKLLLDALGSFQVSRKNLQRLREAGGRVSFFMPMMPFPIHGRANLRNHRKIILVDQKTAFLGGMNLAHEYMGEEKNARRWKDLSFEVEGPIIRDLYAIFRSDWKFAAKEDLPRMEQDNHYHEENGVALQVMPSGPDVNGDPLHEAIVTCFFTAAKRIWVVTPYFIPDEMILQALCIAARKGIDVRLIVPKRSNHPITDLVRGSYLRQSQQAGVKVFRYKEGMVHGKLVIIDDSLSITGSANMDMRSLFLNYEIGLFVHGEQKTAELAAWVSSLMESSERGVKPASTPSEVFEGVGRLLAPLL